MVKTKTKKLLALLLDTNYIPKSKYALAKEAGCTPTWVIKFLKRLENKKIVKGLKVKNAKALFELFHKKRPKKQIYKTYSINNASKLIESIKSSGMDYAFTTYVAENILQKYLFSHRIDIYVKKENFEAWHEKMNKIGLYGGGNLRVIVSEYGELFNKKQFNDKNKRNEPWIVNMPQLISDLFAEGGPAKEAGEMMLKKLEKRIEAK